MTPELLGAYEGEMVDGMTAVVHSVVIAPQAIGLAIRLVLSGAEEFWPYRDLVAEPFARGLVQVGYRPRAGAQLSCREAAFADVLSAAGVRGLVRARGRTLRWVLLGNAVGICLLVVAYFRGVPVLSSHLAHQVPFEVEASLGAPLRQAIAEDLCETPAARLLLDRIADRLALANAGDRRPRVDILNWRMVNALTFPGGNVVVTRGLLAETESGDEIAGILGHEFEHVRRRHVMAHILRGSILALGWVATVGDFSGMMVLDPRTAFDVATQSFSRDDERAADDGALVRLSAASISPQGFGAFFARLEKAQGRGPAWLSTHPGNAERIERISRQGEPAHATPVFGPGELAILRAACDGKPDEGNFLKKVF